MPLVGRFLCYGLVPPVLLGFLIAWLSYPPILQLRAFPWVQGDLRTLEEVIRENQQRSAQIEAHQEMIDRRNEKLKGVAAQLIAEEVSLPEAVHRFQAIWENTLVSPTPPISEQNLCASLPYFMHQVLADHPEQRAAVRARLEPQVRDYLTRWRSSSETSHSVVPPESLWLGWPPGRSAKELPCQTSTGPDERPTGRDSAGQTAARLPGEDDIDVLLVGVTGSLLRRSGSLDNPGGRKPVIPANLRTSK